MRALITGVTGQDGSYLAERLLERGDRVWGMVRRTSEVDPWRIRHLTPKLNLVDGDVTDTLSLLTAIEEAKPDVVYHLAAQSDVGRSWREPLHTAEVTGLGAVRLFEAVRRAAPKARVYHASTSELFGDAIQLLGGPATSSGPFLPRSPYGTAKLLAHSTAGWMRDAYGLFICTGILFNHESPRRGPNFVTRKVAMGAARIAAGLQSELRLGNLGARRDWGWAPEYVEAMIKLVEAPRPMDVVVATGQDHSVEDLCREAFARVGLDWRDHVRTDAALARPSDIERLVGDPTEALDAIGWRAEVSFSEMVHRMVAAEVEATSRVADGHQRPGQS